MATSQPSQQVASYWQVDEYDPRPLQDHQKAMIAACESGDLASLQQLFEKWNVKRGDPPIYRFAPESGAPDTWRIITAAVAEKHPSIVSFLLSTYPKVNLRHGVIVRAVLDSPDRNTLDILQSHPDPNSRPDLPPSSFSNFEWDDHCTTFLTEACRSSEDWLINYLLDHGADPTVGWIHGGALDAALTASRSIEVIQKLIDRGALINCVTVHSAIRHQRPDVLKIMFSDRNLVQRIDDAVAKSPKLLDLAYEKKNEEVITLVKEYVKDREQRVKTRNEQPKTGEEGSSEVREKEAGTEKRWWQVWRAENESVVNDCNTSELGSTVNLLREHDEEKYR